MPKLHKIHAQRLQIDTSHPNLSLTDVAGAAPPTRKHARSVTSDAAPEEHIKKRSLRQNVLSPTSAESADSSCDPSESGASDGESSASVLTEQGRPSGLHCHPPASPGVSGHSPVAQWMQFASPENMSQPGHGFLSHVEEARARQIGIYEADSIIGARDQRVNARFNEVNPVHRVQPSSASLSVASTHKRKPPAVPSRAHKPSNMSNTDLTACNPASPSPGSTPWSPQFIAHRDLEHDGDDNESVRSYNLERDGKDGCKTLGFAALAQALRETGNKIGIGHHHNGSSRKDSMKRRRPRTEVVEGVAEPGSEPHPDTKVVSDVDAPVVVRKWGSGDQSSGWTTFA